MKIRGELFSSYERTTAIDLAGPVSYTHLDVYKRQTKARGGLLLSDYEAALQRAGGTFHEVFAVDCLLYTSWNGSSTSTA